MLSLCCFLILHKNSSPTRGHMTILKKFFTVVDFWAPQSGKIRDTGEFLLFSNVQLLLLFYILILHELPFQRAVTWLYLKHFLIGSNFSHPDQGKSGIIKNFYCSGMATQVSLGGSEVLYQKNQEWSLYTNFFTGPGGRV